MESCRRPARTRPPFDTRPVRLQHDGSAPILANDVDRVLADIERRHAHTVGFFANAARALGIDMAPPLQQLADEVIE